MNCTNHVNQASINTRFLADRVIIPLPPIAQQHRIVQKIEELFTELDAGVTTLRRVQAKLKRYRAAILKAAVEGTLTEAWRSEHADVEPAPVLLQRILQERRSAWEQAELAKFARASKTPPKDWQAKYKEPGTPSTGNLPQLPAGWCWATVEQVSHFARYGTSAKASDAASGVPVLRMGNIQQGALDLSDLKYLPATHQEFPDLVLERGDLLFNRTNSAELVGKSAVFKGSPDPCSYASYLIAVRMVTGCLPEFVNAFLNSVYGRSWVASVVSQQVGQANVNGTKLQALTIPLPPLAEQEQIVAEVERRLSVVAETEAQVEAELKRAERLRQSILNQAFAGKLVPQDPEDEPAGVLLERIRSQRRAGTDTGQPKKAVQLRLV
jgi:type I restriction enzyme S subunit